MGAGGEGTAPKEGVRIIPDDENNLLVVVAPPYEWRIISQVLKRLDIIPRQVMVEVLIAEVNLTGDLKYGVEWFLNARQTTPQTTTTGGTGQQTTTTPPSLDILTGASAIFSTALGGFTFAAKDAANAFRGVVTALAAEDKLTILASPHIMAANNQEARIQIGDEVPILTSTSTPLISQVTSLQTQTVQYRSTGIILLVKSQINAKGMISLEITQEVSNAVTTTTGVNNTPTFTIRSAKTSLITGDGQSIVLGGLIREDVTRNKTGAPGLRKIPILGALFGTQEVKRTKNELLVMITPHIITNLEEGGRLTDEVKERIGLEEIRSGQGAATATPASSPNNQKRR